MRGYLRTPNHRSISDVGPEPPAASDSAFTLRKRVRGLCQDAARMEDSRRARTARSSSLQTLIRASLYAAPARTDDVPEEPVSDVQKHDQRCEAPSSRSRTSRSRAVSYRGGLGESSRTTGTWKDQSEKRAAVPAGNVLNPLRLQRDCSEFHAPRRAAKLVDLASEFPRLPGTRHFGVVLVGTRGNHQRSIEIGLDGHSSSSNAFLGVQLKVAGRGWPQVRDAASKPYSGLRGRMEEAGTSCEAGAVREQ